MKTKQDMYVMDWTLDVLSNKTQPRFLQALCLGQAVFVRRTES